MAAPARRRVFEPNSKRRNLLQPALRAGTSNSELAGLGASIASALGTVFLATLAIAFLVGLIVLI